MQVPRSVPDAGTSMGTHMDCDMLIDCLTAMSAGQGLQMQPLVTVSECHCLEEWH